MKDRLRWLKTLGDRRKCHLEENRSDPCSCWQCRKTQSGLGNVVKCLKSFPAPEHSPTWVKGWAPCWKALMSCREGGSLAGTCKRTVNATLLMVEGNGALTMGLGNYCLTWGQVGNPMRQRQFHTYTDHRRWEGDSCSKTTTTERQMLQ